MQYLIALSSLAESGTNIFLENFAVIHSGYTSTLKMEATSPSETLCVSTNNMTSQSSQCIPQIHHSFPVIRTTDNLMSVKMCPKSLQISISTYSTVTEMLISQKVHSLKLLVPVPGWSVLDAELFLPSTMLQKLISLVPSYPVHADKLFV